MTFLAAKLSIVGSDERINTADQILSSRFCGSPRTLESEGAVLYYATLTIVEELLDEWVGVDRAIEWLLRNEESLMELIGDKTLEIECGLTVNDGSRFLTIPVEGLEVLSNLDCSLKFQFMQEILR